MIGIRAFNSGDGPVPDQGNGSGRERGSYFSVQYFVMVLG